MIPFRSVVLGLVLLVIAIRPCHGEPSLNRTNLLEFRDSQKKVAPVRTKLDWGKRREEIITGMEEVMGPLPGKDKRCPLDVRVEEEKDCGDYVQRRLTYASEPGSRVPAYLLVPKCALDGREKFPAVLCLHPTDMQVGYQCIIGPQGNSVPYAAELARRGFVVLAPAYPLMANYQPDLKALGYRSGTMKAIWDNVRGLDLLDDLAYVQRGNYAVVGHSLGGHNAIFTAVFDSRIRTVVSSCGFDSFRDYHDGNIAGWTQERYMPRLADYPAGRTPFDFYELIAALAPRVCFINAPQRDSNFKWQSVDRIAAEAGKVYRLLGASGALMVEHPDCDHSFPPAMREKAYAVIEQNAEAIPADLPLPASPPSKEGWLKNANILQPWGPSEARDIADPWGRPQRITRELGFNTIVILPREAHNASSDPKDHETEAQFRRALVAYRAAGYHIILYTSIQACGMTAEYDDGRLTREHPDWWQRDPAGQPVTVYGHPWLCPSTPAREYCLDYALRLAQLYHPDGLLLDNNEFFQTAVGWTCHCASCTAAFRRYLRLRFGEGQTRRLFGAAPETLDIPSQPGPLFSVWLRWRNRVWAGINESYRAHLRAIDSRMILFGNTQYLCGNGLLATDQQFEHEDIIVSESCNLGSWQMSEKMVLGGAVAEGRSVWNYIGTFVDSADYSGLKPPGVVGPLIAATLAHGARPWIVDGFDDGQTNAAARAQMADLLGWHAAHPEYFAGQPWTPVGVVISLDSRNLLGRPEIPPHLASLLQNGVPVAGIRDDKITAASLKPFRVVTLETAGCLNQRAACALAEWVRRGGILIAASDAGSYDELGRRRTSSVLWEMLGLDEMRDGEIAVGKGWVMVPPAGTFATAAVKHTRKFSFAPQTGSGLEIVPRRTGGSMLLQVVRHGEETPNASILLPASLRPHGRNVEWITPGQRRPRTLPLISNAEGWTITLAHPPVFSIVRLSMSEASSREQEKN
jgi:dienelactone hydrolase